MQKESTFRPWIIAEEPILERIDQLDSAHLVMTVLGLQDATCGTWRTVPCFEVRLLFNDEYALLGQFNITLADDGSPREVWYGRMELIDRHSYNEVVTAGSTRCEYTSELLDPTSFKRLVDIRLAQGTAARLPGDLKRGMRIYSSGRPPLRLLEGPTIANVFYERSEQCKGDALLG